MNKAGPLVSILMVTYNSEKFLKESIESVLNQSCDDFELIISDDKSSDNSWDIIRAYTDGKKVHGYKQSVNLGEYANRNFCIEKATGDYVIFVDGEDLLYYHAVETLSFYIKKYREVAMIIAREWDERIIYPKVISPREFLLFEYLDRGISALNFTRVLFSREVLLKLNSFDYLRIRGGDAYIQYKIGSQYPSLIISSGFSWWRRRKGQASEKLLKDSFNIFNDDNKFKINILQNTLNLSQEEKDIAYNNYYGNILRYVLRKIFKFQFASTIRYINNNPIPLRFLKSIAKRPQRYYFNAFGGENPLRE